MPKQVLIHNLSQDNTLEAEYCSSFLCQLRGLTFRRKLPRAWGLLLVQSRESRLEASIHMFFMWMELAVVWINAQGEVIDVKLAKPWRPAYFPQRPAQYVLETSVDYLSQYRVGDRVQFEMLNA